MPWDERDLFLSHTQIFGQGYALIAFSVGSLIRQELKFLLGDHLTSLIVLLNFQNKSDKHSQNKTRLKSSYNPKYPSQK